MGQSSLYKIGDVVYLDNDNGLDIVNFFSNEFDWVYVLENGTQIYQSDIINQNGRLYFQYHVNINQNIGQVKIDKSDIKLESQQQDPDKTPIFKIGQIVNLPEINTLDKNCKPVIYSSPTGTIIGINTIYDKFMYDLKPNFDIPATVLYYYESDLLEYNLNNDHNQELNTQSNNNKVDMVNSPPHYTQFPMQLKDWNFAVIETMKDKHWAAYFKTVSEYLHRAHLKNGVQDLEKAIFWLQDAVDRIKNNQFEVK